MALKHVNFDAETEAAFREVHMELYRRGFSKSLSTTMRWLVHEYYRVLVTRGSARSPAEQKALEQQAVEIRPVIVTKKDRLKRDIAARNDATGAARPVGARARAHHAK